MFRWADTVTNTRGDSLVGWQVECVQLSDGETVVPIFADENSTPIETVSGVTNRAVSDDLGNYEFYVADGTYSLKFFDDAGVFQRLERFFTMYGADNAAAAAASAAAAQAAADSITLTGVFAEAPTLPQSDPALGTEYIIIQSGSATEQLTLVELANYINSVAPQPELTIASLSRPTLTLTEPLNSFGDSVGAGVGAPTGEDWPAQFRTLATSDLSFQFNGGGPNDGTVTDIGNGGVGGESSLAITARLIGLSPTFADQLGRTTFYCAGLNDLNDDLVDFARDWPAQVKTSYETAAAALTGGKRLVSFLAPSDNFDAGGTTKGADHSFHGRDMRASHGALAFDLERYMRFDRQLAAPTGTADALAIERGFMPYTYRGGSSDFASNDFATIQGPGSPSDLSQPEGTIYWDQTSSTSSRKIGASGAGSYENVDTKHFSKHGYAVIARVAGDIAKAEEGSGPPVVAPSEFRIAADAANGAVVGTVQSIGTATRYALRTMTDGPVTDFAISSTGIITKTGTPTEGAVSLAVVAENANGVLVSPVDIYVTRPSTVTAPQMRTITTGVSLCGRMANGMTDGQQISYASWFSSAALANQQLALLTRNNSGGGASQPVSINLLSNGNQRITVRDASNAAQIITMSAQKYAANTPVWLLMAFDFATNTSSVYLTEAAQTVASLTDQGNYQIGDANPLFLSANETRVLRDLVNPFVGDVGFVAFWDSYIDWSTEANRRALFDVSGNPVTRTPYAAIGGQVPRLEMWGGVGDWLYGTPDGSNGPQTMSITYQARTLLT